MSRNRPALASHATVMAALLAAVAAASLACSTPDEPLAPPIVDPDRSVTDPDRGAADPDLGAIAPGDPAPQAQMQPKQGTSLANLAAVIQPIPRDQARAQAAPFELTASDGTGLRLRSVDAKVIVDGPLAFTELHLIFDNPQPRQIEGRFSLTLPPGAAVSRFAMKTQGRWMEGEMVARHRAQRIYEDYLHKRQDPALLEVDAGNRFRARVFPIPARGRKHLIVSWSQERTDPKTAYRLPLVGLPTLDLLRVRAWLYGAAGGPRLVQLDRRDLQPAVDLELYPSAIGPAVQGFRSGRVAMARVTASRSTKPAQHDEAWLLVDTSASTTRYQGATLALLPKMGRTLAAAGVSRVVVVAFDQETKVVWRGAPDALGDCVPALRQRGAMGASDLDHALASLAELGDDTLAKRLVLVTDGVITAGAREPDALRERLRVLARRGVRRVDAVSLAAARDEPLLTTLVQGQVEEDGVFIRPGRDGADLARLARRTLAPVQVVVPGAAWVWPQTLRGLQAGQSALVWAELPENAAFEVQLSGGMTGVQRPQTRPALAPLLERAWVQARIAMLSAAHMGDATEARARLKEKAVALSLRHRVLSPWTAFLVLENERELRRYGIDRTRSADILAVSATGQAVRLSRQALHHDDRSGLRGDRDLHRDPDLDPDSKVAEDPKSESRMDRDTPSRREERGRQPDLEATASPRRPGPRAATTDAEESAGDHAKGQAKGQAKAAANKDVVEALAGARAVDEREPTEDLPATSRGQGGFAPSGRSVPSAQRDLRDRLAPTDRLAKRGGGEDDDGPSSTSRPEPRAPRPPIGRDAAAGLGDGGFGLRGEASGGGGASGGAASSGDGAARVGRIHGLGHIDAGSGRGRRSALGRRPWFDGGPIVVRTTSLRIVGPLAKAVVERGLRARTSTFQACVARELRYGRIQPRGWMRFTVWVGADGGVNEVDNTRSTFNHAPNVGSCMMRQLRRLRFPPRNLGSTLTWTLTVTPGLPSRPGWQPPHTAHRPPARIHRGSRELAAARHKAADHKAMTGRMRDLQRLLDRKQPRLARDLARRWAADKPDDVLAWVALGRALHASGHDAAAARAWGSILDLHPSRADLRRFAGNLLEQVVPGRALALDTYREATRQRPDHPSGHVQLALAQARMGDMLGGLSSLRIGLDAHRRHGRDRRGVDKTIRRLMQVLAGAWLTQHPKDTDRITQAAGWVVPDSRAVGLLLLTWETDANDVDLHVFGRDASHAFFSRKVGAAGRLTADVTKGYGPELFESRDTRSRRVLVHYYRRGPMGWGLGRVLRVNHDGRGGVRISGRPFVAMRDHAWVDAGTL